MNCSMKRSTKQKKMVHSVGPLKKKRKNNGRRRVYQIQTIDANGATLLVDTHITQFACHLRQPINKTQEKMKQANEQKIKIKLKIKK